uniref:Uncharacterized protein LOC111128307 n=1 Tax=Crassostrea virginica TaxID=6565 RepID=A0A8B8DN21_CRAVI|nr:uncharacterized protein LOC111128307 [Crassostrea virginica]
MNLSAPQESTTRERGNLLEVLLPPLGLILGGVLVLALLVVCTSGLCRHFRSRQRCVSPSPSHARLTSPLFTSGRSLISVTSPSCVEEPSGFFTRNDLLILEHLQKYQNNPKYLYKIGIPAVTSLTICSLIMAAYQPIIDFLWSHRTQPAINEAVACFLAPAGMVFAVSFGFAFQQVLQKQIDITARLNNDFSEMELLMNLTKKLYCLKSRTRMKMYIALKDEIMAVIQYITEMDCLQTRKEGTIWDIIDCLREIPAQRHNVDRALIHDIIKYVGSLNSIVDKVGTLHARIHPLQWVFLEVLGFSSFLGIQLVKCESPRLELAMSFVTCLSISLSCYIVADIDTPFHGFFRVDLKSVSNILADLENCYCREDVQTNRCDGAGLSNSCTPAC